MSTQRNTPTPPRRPRHSALTGVIALAAAATLGVACSDAGAPAAPEAPAPAAAPSLNTASYLLNLQLETEKRRIAAMQEASKRQYDALKVQWQWLNKQYPGGNQELLYCDPLQYAADTKIIGPEGGDMSVGPHKLSIPRGALTKRTVITGEMPVALTVGVKMSPHGLQFAKGVKLTLSYKHCNRPTTWNEQVVYVDNLNRILERPLSTDRNSDGLVDATIWHFSGYMVSWGRSRSAY